MPNAPIKTTMKRTLSNGIEVKMTMEMRPEQNGRTVPEEVLLEEITSAFQCLLWNLAAEVIKYKLTD